MRRRARAAALPPRRQRGIAAWRGGTVARCAAEERAAVTQQLPAQRFLFAALPRFRGAALMSGWNLDSPQRDRFGDDDDDFPLSQRSPYFAPSGSDYSTGVGAVSTWGNAAAYLSYAYPGARCATPVHRPAARSPASPRAPRGYVRQPPEACQSCGTTSRTVEGCCNDRCFAAACITCRAAQEWQRCDSCAELFCTRHQWPYAFRTRECCGLHLLTEEAYHLCRYCAVHLAPLLPPEEHGADDAAHGVFPCTHCGRETCHHALHCRGCGLQCDVQRRMVMARCDAAPVRLPFEDQIRGMANPLLAKDIAQYLHSCYEPEPLEPEPEPQAIRVPLRRAAGRRTNTKHARRLDPGPL